MSEQHHLVFVWALEFAQLNLMRPRSHRSGDAWTDVRLARVLVDSGGNAAWRIKAFG